MRARFLMLSATLFLAGPMAAVVAPTVAFAQSAAVAVAPQYDTTHVYVAPADVDRFVQSFTATFGGQSTPQVVVNVLPVPSSTTSQLIQTPVGTVSLFGFKTPIPRPFGDERNGYLVKDMDVAIKEARQAGADVIVSDFPDPIGRDAVVQWPGGVNMQLYWHTKVPENRVYVSNDRAAAFVKAFVAFSHGKVVSDEQKAPGIEIGRADATFHRIRIESPFGKMVVLATDGHLPYPFGHDNTGYEVANLQDTLGKARAAGVNVLVEPFTSEGRTAAVVEFPGGYVAEIHQTAAAG
jgi:predicted enzyme related to lactoylglutathione lyase